MSVEHSRVFTRGIDLPYRGGKPSEFRRPMLEYLLEQQAQHPFRAVRIQHAARNVGCSRETARSLYNELFPIYQLPPRTGDNRANVKYLDPTILTLYHAGNTVESISDMTGLSEGRVRNSLIRSGERILTKRELDAQRKKQLVYLRNELGLGDRAIVEETGLSKGVVSNKMVALMAEGKARRLRKQKRAKEELSGLDQKVENAFKRRRKGGKRPTYKKMAKEAQCSVLDVEHSLKRLRRQKRL